jgi:selenide,water dikinase
LTDDLAIVQSVDFFSPNVDDPFEFGRIAAANALSDIYTNGATPVTALNIIGFPCKLGTQMITEILSGGADAVREAGAVILGGHTIDDLEPKYGLAVTGVVNPAKMITNTGAKPGDALLLTKKIGVGIVTSIVKLKNKALGRLGGGGAVISETVHKEAITAMKRINKNASAAMLEFEVNACTDISGFGLLGHARNIAENSGVSLSISYSKTPRYEGVEQNAIRGSKGGGERNYSWIEKFLHTADGVSKEQIMVMCDPQTSGGLLMAIDEGKADKLLNRLKDGGDEAAIIGQVDEGEPGVIKLNP